MITLDGSWRAKNAPKLSKYLMDKICKIKQYCIINWWHKSNYSSSPEDILKSAKKRKKKKEKLYTKETTSKAATTEFLSKIPNRKKISNEDFNLCEEEISLDEIIKSINFQTSNKSPDNDGLKAVFYKHFSNELDPVFLDVCDSWEKHGTISVTSRTGIISATYKKGDKRDIENYRPTSFLNLYYKIYTTILKGYLRYKTVFCRKVALDV